MAIEDPALRRAALLQVALSAEDSRNLLMESQKSTVRFLKKQPEEFIPKLLSGASSKDINARLSELRESLCAVNMVSLAAAMAYRELGEEAAAQRSLAYYAEFLEKTYLGADGILERMDMIDPLPDNYWSRTLPEIAATARALPCAKEPAPKKTKKCGRTKK